jgi:hypothetical protein
MTVFGSLFKANTKIFFRTEAGKRSTGGNGMNYDLEFAQRIECSADEKRKCMKLVADLLNMAYKARNYGMLSLAKDAEETSSFLLQKGIQLATDGAKPHVVRSVLEFYILCGNYSGKDLLERCIILEGILGIQEGLHPKLLKELLLSFFGEEKHQLFKDQLAGPDKNDLHTYLKKIEGSQAASATGKKLSSFVIKLDDEAIKKFLREINTPDLAKALSEMSGRAILKIFKNMPEKGALLLKEILGQTQPESKLEITEAQARFIKMLSGLKKRGESERHA